MMKTTILALILALLNFSRLNAEPGGFPFMLPDEKPDRPLSAAMERNYDAYLAPRPEDNELYSQFKYTELKGFDYNGHDGTISRRDPSKVIFANGAPGEWDQYSIHDPYPLVHDGKIYLYYKSDSGERGNLVRMHGLAIADNPLGPFKKHPLNPVVNSGHETTLFPFMQGVAALVIRDGNEHYTIQYAKDWVNFEIAAITSMLPHAGGPYVPDAFSNTRDGRGITWGLSHFTNAGGPGKGHSVLARFDCDLSRDLHDPVMKKHHVLQKPEFYYQHGLSKAQRERIAKVNRELTGN